MAPASPFDPEGRRSGVRIWMAVIFWILLVCGQMYLHTWWRNLAGELAGVTGFFRSKLNLHCHLHFLV